MNINQIIIIKNNKEFFNVNAEELKQVDRSILAIVENRNDICNFFKDEACIKILTDEEVRITNIEIDFIMSKLQEIKNHTDIIDSFVLSKNQILFTKFMERSKNDN